jgi:gluconolactonase
MIVQFMPVAGGYGLLESPRAGVKDVWFSDMALGGVHRLRADGGVDRWLPDRRMIGGIAINEDGVLLCSGTGGIVWVDPVTGATGTLLDTIDGVPISGVNDMIADSEGGLYFGTVDHDRMFRGEDFFGRSAIYRLSVDGCVRRLCEGIGFSNGMGISPDGRRLYLNNSSVGTFEYDVTADGGLSVGRQISGRADCDGLAIDIEGGIWIAQISAGTVTRILRSGEVDQEIPVPGGHVTSLCLGGLDGRDMFVTTAAPGAGEAVMKRTAPADCTAYLYHARVDVPGLLLGRTRFRLAGG